MSLKLKINKVKEQIKENYRIIRDAKLTPEAQARQDEMLRNPIKGAWNTFMDLPKQSAQREEEAGDWLNRVTGGKLPPIVGMVGMSLLDPLSPPGGKAPISAVKNVLRKNSLKTVVSKITDRADLPAFRKTTAGKNILEKAYKHLEEFGDFKNFKEGADYGVIARNKRGRGKVDFENRKGVSLDVVAGREADTARRVINTEINPAEVFKLTEKYKVDKSVGDAFLKKQIAGKKAIEDIVAKINKRVDDTVASLGHIRAAEKSGGAADILSNLELEDFFKNVKRSNKAELPPELTQALGVSKNLEEEFLRHIFPELQSFWKMSKLQKNKLKAYVSKGMDVNDALKKVGFGDPNIQGQKLKIKK